jgi:diguanylate cyclase (GGDEF)-like protein
MAIPEPGRPAGGSQPVEDSFFNLLIDSLEGLDQAARGLFLQRLLKSLTQLELTESESLETWDRIVERRIELSRVLGRPVALKTAMMDFLASENWLRAPILMEYEQLKKLQVNAATDSLTQLYNRRLFEEYFEKELDRAKRYDLSLALIIVDLHVFKMVNDKYGHQRGDAILQDAARTLRHSMRASDFAFRIGGDEFALLLPQADAEQAATLGRRIHTKFAALIEPQHLDIPLGLDFGLAVFPQDGDQIAVLMRVADERLYQMKLSLRGDSGVDFRASAHTPERRVAHATQPAAESTSTAAETPQKPAPESPSHAETRVSPTLRTVPPVERRKWERLSLIGKRALATIANGPAQPLRILDMSHGGVALEGVQNVALGESFQAVLNVPILGEVRVKLKKLYIHSEPGQPDRVGCLFIT